MADDLRRPIKNNPRGTEKYDLGALSPEQQLQLNDQKIQTRKENEEYLSKHPEIYATIGESLQYLLTVRPKNGEEIRKLLADFFKEKAVEEESKNEAPDAEE